MLEKIVKWQKSRIDSYDFTKNSHCMIFDKKELEVNKNPENWQCG